MSLSPFSETRVGFFAGCCGAVHLRGFVRKTVVSAHAAAYAAGEPDTDTRIAATVKRAGWALAGKQVTVVAGAELNRYFVLKRSAALKREADWFAYARARAAQACGGVPEHWRVSISAMASGVRVASAIEASRLTVLTRTVEALGARAVRVVPYFSLAFERVRRAVPKTGRLWLAVCEPNAITLVAVDDGSISRISHLRTHSAERIAQQIALEELRMGWEAGQAYIHWQAGGQNVESRRREGAFALPAAVALLLVPPEGRRDALVAEMLH